MDKKIFQHCAFYRTAHNSSQWTTDGKPEVILLGRSNVGKSSLINSLCNRKQLARTAQTPGKTRELVYYNVGDRFYICDLPGYGFARGRRGRSSTNDFSNLVDGYLQSSRPIACFLLLLDIRHEPSQLDMQMIAWLLHHDFPLNIVLTKGDKLSRQKQRQQIDLLLRTLPDLGDVDFYLVSNQTKEGIDELRMGIIDAVKLFLEGEARGD